MYLLRRGQHDMRIRVLLCTAIFSLFILCSGFSPSGGYYMDVTTSELGAIRIYTLSSYCSGYFALDSGIPVNMSGNSITGYVLDNSGNRQYNIFMYPYGEQWQYRSSASGYNNYDLHVTGVDLDSSTIQFMGVDIPQDVWTLYLFVFLIGAVLLVLWSRKGG